MRKATVYICTWCGAVLVLYLVGKGLRGDYSPRYFSASSWLLIGINAAIVGLTSCIVTYQRGRKERTWTLFLIDRASNVSLSISSIFVASGVVIAGHKWVLPWGQFTPYVYYMQKEMASASISTLFILAVATNSVLKAFIYTLIPYAIFQLCFTPYPTPAEAAIFRSTISDVFVRIRLVGLLGIGFDCIVRKTPISKPLALVLGGYFILMTVAYLGRTPVQVFSSLITYVFVPVKLSVYCLWFYALVKAFREGGEGRDDLQTAV